MFQPSYWEIKHFFKPRDFVVVGSGLVGLQMALAIRRKYKQASIAVLERSFLPYGASTRNAGFACFGSMTEIISDIETMGEEQAWALVEKRLKGIDMLKQRYGAKALQMKTYGGYELFMQEHAGLYEKAVSNLKSVNERLEALTGVKNCFMEVPERIAIMGLGKAVHMMYNTLEGQIDSGSFMQTLIKTAQKNKIEIFNGIEAEAVEQGANEVLISLPGGTQMKAKKVVVCTNAFTQKLLPGEEIIPARAQVLITEPIKNLKIKGTFHFDEGYYYFRNIDNRILLGGARNAAFEEEQTESFGITSTIQNKLETVLNEIILPKQKVNIAHRWSGIMAFGKAKLPLCKQVDKNIYVVARMNGMGVAIGGVLVEDVLNLM